MKIHEYQASQLFDEVGIPTVQGEVAIDLKEAQKIAKNIGFPVVLKSQVLVGGRGKAGGIKVVKEESDFAATFSELQNLTIKGYKVEKIFIVRAINIAKEYYAAITVDAARDDVVFIASSAGGVDIEETAKTNPEAIHKFYFEGKKTIDLIHWAKFIEKIFEDEGDQRQATGILLKLLKLFYQYDCSLVEINPLVITETGKWYAADAKINFDDNALFRQEKIEGLRDLTYEDPDELEAKENGLSFVKLDGNVGCIVNGAGLAMATMDVVKLLGGDPANFLDVGGSSNPEKVITALKIILGNDKVKSILINIFGGITRCDDIAKGLLEARKQLNFDVPMVVRLTGTNEEEAKKLLADNGISTYSSMRDVINEVVKQAK